MNADTVEEESHEGQPAKGFPGTAPEGHFFEAVACKSQSESGDAAKDEDEGDPDAPRLEVEVVELVWD